MRRGEEGKGVVDVGVGERENDRGISHFVEKGEILWREVQRHHNSKRLNKPA